MESRFGDEATIHYHDAGDAEVRSSRADLIESIESQGLLYPVTVVDGVPTYDGAVSYPAILRVVHNRLAEAATEA